MPDNQIDIADLPAGFADSVAGVFGDRGRAWLASLPQTIARCERRWSLEVGRPFEDLSVNWVAPAVCADGTEAVLKIGVPSPGLLAEAAALDLYGGRGCIRLLACDRELGALLMERVRPGLRLWEVAERDDDQATRIVAGVMRRLWRPVPADHSFPSVADWGSGMAKIRPFFDGGTGPLQEALVDEAERLFAELLVSSERSVVLHGDLHQANILSSGREEWLAIDPKGVVGEPTYETGVLLRNLSESQLREPNPALILARRVDILADELGFERARILDWGLAQAVLSAWWCVEDSGDCWDWAMDCAEMIEHIR